MRREVVLETGRGRVIVMDSITKVTPDDVGAVVVAASHGGTSSGEFALEVPLELVVLNDAGIGKDEAGIAALGMLQSRGVAGATVSHDTARIGDSLDMWECGVISRVNEAARSKGLEARQKLRDAVATLIADR
jgi:hypothetical protein